jgi:hypothetical protein
MFWSYTCHCPKRKSDDLLKEFIRAVWSGSMLFTISFSTCNRVGIKQKAWILIRLRGCAGWSGSMLVANTLCWFCRDAAQIWNKFLHRSIDVLDLAQQKQSFWENRDRKRSKILQRSYLSRPLSNGTQVLTKNISSSFMSKETSVESI